MPNPYIPEGEITPAPDVNIEGGVGRVTVDSDATEGLIQAIPEVIRESKSGVKTTEFWVAIVLTLLTVIDGIPLPEQYEGLVAGAIGVAYAISRGLAKQGVPHVEAA